MDKETLLHCVNVLSAVFCVCFGCAFAAVAQGFAVGKGLDAMSRQPEVAGDLRMSMIIGLAMIESLAIYCLLTALILLFVRW